MSLQAIRSSGDNARVNLSQETMARESLTESVSLTLGAASFLAWPPAHWTHCDMRIIGLLIKSFRASPPIPHKRGRGNGLYRAL